MQLMVKFSFFLNLTTSSVERCCESAALPPFSIENNFVFSNSFNRKITQILKI